jgi:hypothetical protein
MMLLFKNAHHSSLFGVIISVENWRLVPCMHAAWQRLTHVMNGCRCAAVVVPVAHDQNELHSCHA